jgi:hypothetical protein
MPTLASSKRKSSEKLVPDVANGQYVQYEDIARLDKVIRCGDVDRERPRREEVFERRSRAMLERRQRAIESLPAISPTQLSRVIQLQIGLAQVKLPPLIKDLFLKIGMAHGATLQEILIPGRGNREVCICRRLIALHLRAQGLSFPRIARYMNCHHTSVIYQLRHATYQERQAVECQIKAAQEQRVKQREPVNYQAWDEWI